jgi:SAM-dependent methyltransferase
MAINFQSRSAAELLFERRHQLFLNFDAHTTQTEQSRHYLKNQLEQWATSLTPQSPFNYLDVGCGFGNRTLSIIDTLIKHTEVNPVALDPSKQLLQLFNQNKGSHSIELICSTWEDYSPSAKFDFVSSIHTFYYIDDWQSAIYKMLDVLNRKGKLCIAIRSQDQVCQFRNHFFGKLFDDQRKERDCDELIELLDRLNICFKLDYVDSVLDIGNCLQQNEKGKQLLEFVLRQPFEALEHLTSEIVSYLDRIQKNGVLTQRDGYVWISAN